MPDVIMLLSQMWSDGIPVSDYPRMVALVRAIGAPAQPPARVTTQSIATKAAPTRPVKAKGRPRVPQKRPQATRRDLPLTQQVREILSAKPEGMTARELEEAVGGAPNIHVTLNQVGAEPVGKDEATGKNLYGLRAEVALNGA
jgi:hypothetical protein